MNGRIKFNKQVLYFTVKSFLVLNKKIYKKTIAFLKFVQICLLNLYLKPMV